MITASRYWAAVNRGASNSALQRPDESDPASPVVLRFEDLYTAWFHQVSSWVRAMGARTADCDDLVQEVFLVAHRRLASFDGQHPGGWLYQITRHKVRDYRQLSWVKHFFSRDTILPFDALRRESNTPLEHLQTLEKSRLLSQLLEVLTVDERATFVLFEIEGQSGEHIAALQNVPLNTVWGRLLRARKKLQSRLSRRPQT